MLSLTISTVTLLVGTLGVGAIVFLCKSTHWNSLIQHLKLYVKRYIWTIFSLIIWIAVIYQRFFGCTSYNYNICKSIPYPGNHSLGIIVPFRQRESHLEVFVNVLDSFFQNVQQKYQIIVIEQGDARSFNRGRLFNVGYTLEKNNFDYFCFHDVDLIPAELCIDYTYPKAKEAVHVAVNTQKLRWRLYNSAGGVVCMRTEDYNLTNGFNNDYWGWGGEDDDFAIRIKLAGMRLIHSSHGFFFSLYTGHEDRDLAHYEATSHRLNQSESFWQLSGLNTLNYTVKYVQVYPLYKHYKIELLPPDVQI